MWWGKSWRAYHIGDVNEMVFDCAGNVPLKIFLKNIWECGGKMCYFAPMQYENIKFKKEVVDRIRENKRKTGIPIATFAEKAVLKELPPIEKISQRIKSSSKKPK